MTTTEQVAGIEASYRKGFVDATKDGYINTDEDMKFWTNATSELQFSWKRGFEDAEAGRDHRYDWESPEGAS